jgi:hypothetical protein
MFVYLWIVVYCSIVQLITSGAAGIHMFFDVKLLAKCYFGLNQGLVVVLRTACVRFTVNDVDLNVSSSWNINH